MRLLFILVAMMAATLAGPAIAQVSAPAMEGTAPPSVLVPRMPDALPAPTPIAPDSNAQPPAPQGFAPARTDPGQTNPGQTNAPGDLGTVTAVPLPPPGVAPTRVPPEAAPRGPAEPVTATAPTGIGAPISLAPPRSQPPPLQPTLPASPALSASSAQSAKPGAKAPPAALVSNKLPTPALSPEASPADFLRAARGALAAGRIGEARSALEMAQTRLLDRVVDAGKEQEPSSNAAVKQISDAINALVVNDRMACLRYIEFASQTIGSPLD